MTLNDLERPKCTLGKKCYGAYQKEMNEDKAILLGAKCGPLILMSTYRNVKFRQIFAEFLRERLSNDGGVVEVCVFGVHKRSIIDYC